MEAQNIYTLREIIILIILTTIGTVAFLGFAFISKKMQINLKNAIIIFSIDLFVVCLIVEALRLTDYFKYRYIAELGAAYFGLYLMQYIDKRSFNLFDLLIKKTTGIEVDKSQEPEQQKSEE